jgi:23S rRNA (guanine745-N1)-methyltransferase
LSALLEKIELHDRILLKTPEQIVDLFAMTPYYHRTPRQGHERLGQLAELETEISFEVLVYRQS